MPPAKDFQCRVLSKVWLTPTTFEIRFSPSKRFRFEAGQFISVLVPTAEGDVRRAYSLASGPEISRKSGVYSLCIKHVQGGKGSSYLANLNPGDSFLARAPYGDFVYRPSHPGRILFFVASGSGIAPLKSMIESQHFWQSAPSKVILLFGAQNQEEILYAQEIEKYGVQFIPALSRQEATWGGFRGRVTDYLKSMPREWRWFETDFYLCGNGNMLNDVSNFLIGSLGLPVQQIKKESFGLTPQRRTVAHTPSVQSLLELSQSGKLALFKRKG